MSELKADKRNSVIHKGLDKNENISVDWLSGKLFQKGSRKLSAFYQEWTFIVMWII